MMNTVSKTDLNVIEVNVDSKEILSTVKGKDPEQVWAERMASRYAKLIEECKSEGRPYQRLQQKYESLKQASIH